MPKKKKSKKAKKVKKIKKTLLSKKTASENKTLEKKNISK